MRRKMLSLLLTVTLLLGVLPTAALAGYENFTTASAYTGQFTDVAASAWYAQNVQRSYEYGLINGKTATTFAPDSTLTLAEAIKLAACLHSVYETGKADFTPSSPWYQTYVDYAKANGLLPLILGGYDRPATRAQFASVLALALPEDALATIGNVEDDAIPDVPSNSAYGAAVYTLYRAGVLTGSDSKGNFLPASTIKRSEAAAIVTRMADPTLRQVVTLHLSATLTSAQVLGRCMPAVFKLTSYDKNGNPIATGSGVLISADGEAVTCGHLVNGVYRLVAELSDGKKYEVAGIYDLDTTYDIARISLEGSNFPYLSFSDGVTNGEPAYVLGYPGGNAAKLTAGTVINNNYKENDYALIQTSAVAISGNSGGAMVDQYGRLAGVVVSSTNSGTPSFAVPISDLSRLSSTTLRTEADFTAAHLPDTSRCYANQYPVPDFGTVFSVPLKSSTTKSGATDYYYSKSDLSRSYSSVLATYVDALQANTFYMFSDDVFTSSAGYQYSVRVFESGSEYIVVRVTNSGLTTRRASMPVAINYESSETSVSLDFFV